MVPLCACGRSGSVAFGKQSFCTFCFTGHFEKRVKKAFKERELSKGEKVLVVGQLASYLVKNLIHVPLQLDFMDHIKEGDYDVIITEQTCDDECIAFLEAFAGGSIFSDDVLVLKALRYLTTDEAVAYAQLKGVPFVPRLNNSPWNAFLHGFRNSPEMKYNLLRNADELHKLLEK